MKTKFPTPAEIRAEQEAAAAQEVEAALAAIRTELQRGTSTDVVVTWRWSDPTRRVVTATLNGSGWTVRFGDDLRGGAWCRVSPQQERRSYPPGA